MMTMLFLPPRQQQLLPPLLPPISAQPALPMVKLTVDKTSQENLLQHQVAAQEDVSPGSKSEGYSQAVSWRGHGREWHENVALIIPTNHNTISSSTKVQLQALHCLSNKLSCVREVPSSSETAVG